MNAKDAANPVVSPGAQSLGEGRKLQPFGTCSNSPDGKHHYEVVSCVQSVEHFVCGYCPDEYYD